MPGFFPFFLDCYKLEKDEKRKKQLENLAFGINSAIIFQDNKNVLILDKDQFDIPETFSQTSWDEFKKTMDSSNRFRRYGSKNKKKL